MKGRGREAEQMENQYEDAHHVPLIAPSSRQLRLMDIQTAFQDYLSKRKRGLRVGYNLSNKSSFPQVRKTRPLINLTEINFAKMGNTNSAFESLQG